MLSPTKRGCAVEYRAALLFLEAGFEVFPNISADGPADLIVWDGDTAYPIDTKKLTVYVRADGSKGYSGNYSKKTRVPNVHYLGWSEDGWMWLYTPPERLLEVALV